MNKILIVGVLLIAVAFSACTQNQMAKKYGGSARIELISGQKLVNVTWKEDNLWILTRPRKADESVETYSFNEDSNFGIWQGTVTIVER